MKRLLVAGMMVLSLTLLLVSVTIADNRSDASPATGHSEVVAQGNSTSTTEQVAWRVQGRTLEPELDPINLVGPGFAIARDGSLLVTTAEEHDVRLATSESSFLPGESVTTVSNLSADSAVLETITLDGVPLSTSDNDIIYEGQAFASPSGHRDLDLIRDVLKPKESATIKNGEFPALIFSQSGQITIKNANGGTIELGAGEAGTLTGPLTITSTGSQTASLFIAVIGPEIGTATDSLTPGAATQTAGSTGSHVIDVVIYLCPAGISVAQADPASCGEKSGLGSGGFSITGGELDGPTSPVVDHGNWRWTQLEPGDYVIAIDQFPVGYSDFAIDLDPAARHVDNDIQVSLTEGDSTVSINVYFLDRRDSGSGENASLGLTFFDCPTGTTRDDLAGTSDPGCTHLEADAFNVTLDGDQLSAPLGVDTLEPIQPGQSMSGDWQWTGLPAGAYTLTAEPVQADDAFYFVRPCGDQSCPPVSAFGTSVGFELDLNGLTLIIYRIPA